MTGLCPRCKQEPATFRLIVYPAKALPIGQESAALGARCVGFFREWLVLYEAPHPGVEPADSDVSKGSEGVA